MEVVDALSEEFKHTDNQQTKPVRRRQTVDFDGRTG
jgi:hypothetical protein